MLLLFQNNLQANSTPPLPHGLYGLRSLTSRYKAIQHRGTYIEETVYTHRDNTIELVLSVDGQAINHSGISRVQLLMGASALDSEVSSTLFDLTHTDRLIMELGGAGLAAGRHAAQLIIYDFGDPDGLVWGNLVLVVNP